MKEYTPKELAEFDGKDGKPIYIAHQGKVYDVTGSKLWKTGVHMKRHRAGHDLTTDIQAAPHNADVLERHPQVGTLAKAYVIEPKMPALLKKWIARYPMLRRHPHPMTVHFPIVFMISATVFNILYMVTGIRSFETTALHCLGGGIICLVVAMLTGLYTWWMNYLSQPMRAVRIKQRMGVALLVTAVAVFLLRISTPNVLERSTALSGLYFLLVLALFPMVTVIGWFGASLTFPTERE